MCNIRMKANEWASVFYQISEGRRSRFFVVDLQRKEIFTLFDWTSRASRTLLWQGKTRMIASRTHNLCPIHEECNCFHCSVQLETFLFLFSTLPTSASSVQNRLILWMARTFFSFLSAVFFFFIGIAQIAFRTKWGGERFHSIEQRLDVSQHGTRLGER